MNWMTQRDLIRAVAWRWREQYEPFGKDQPMSCLNNRTKREIADDLDAMDLETATADDVDAVIGNSSWVRMYCDECGLEKESLLTIGQDEDYESQTAHICPTCISEAYGSMVNRNMAGE